jgi:elongation factor G
MNEKLRNIALVAHQGAGKTSLAEAILFNAGAIKRLGRVEDGNTAMDFLPEEHQRQATISTSFHPFSWKKHTINIMDTPGDQNFFSDTKTSMQAADGVVIVVDAVDGILVRTEQAAEFASEFNLPTAIFINKIDKDRADFNRTLDAAKELLEPKPIIVQLPIGQESEFRGIVDLINLKAYVYDDEGKSTETDIPAEMQDQVEMEREALIENVAEADDNLIERYLEGEELSNEDLYAALKKGIHERVFTPVLCGCATKNIALDRFCDFIIESMPSPMEREATRGTDVKGEKELERAPDPEAPFSAYVFKTVIDPYAGRLSIFKVISGTLGSDGNLFNANKDTRERYTQLLMIAGKEQKPLQKAGPGSIVAVAKLKETHSGDTLCDESHPILFKVAQPLPPVISFAVESKNKGDEDKVFSSLAKLMEEDLGLQLDRNTETKEILLSGLGLVHIEATVEKLKRKFNVEVEIKPPKVPYRETITKKTRVQGKHKKQSGGHGQYGDCWVQIEPMERGGGFEFVDKIVGGVIPRQYIPAVEKGIQEASQKGVLAGFPCVDFRAILDDGSYHAVDSSEMAFKVAGSLAFKKAAVDAKPVLLEPVMNVSVVVPEQFLGDVMGDLNSRRGRVLGMEADGKLQVINAHVPMAEILKYAPDLRSMTGGRGTFSKSFSHYDEVPGDIAGKIIAEIKSREA